MSRQSTASHSCKRDCQQQNAKIETDMTYYVQQLEQVVQNEASPPRGEFDLKVAVMKHGRGGAASSSSGISNTSNGQQNSSDKRRRQSEYAPSSLALNNQDIEKLLRESTENKVGTNRASIASTSFPA